MSFFSFYGITVTLKQPLTLSYVNDARKYGNRAKASWEILLNDLISFANSLFQVKVFGIPFSVRVFDALPHTVPQWFFAVLLIESVSCPK